MLKDAPDFRKYVHPTKPVPDATQTMFWWSEGINVAAGTLSSGTIYTVPAGRKLILLAMNISESISSINLVVMLAGSTQFMSTWFDTVENVSFGGEGTITLAAGSVINRQIYNYNSVTVNFRFDVFGVEVDA